MGELRASSLEERIDSSRLNFNSFDLRNENENTNAKDLLNDVYICKYPAEVRVRVRKKRWLWSLLEHELYVKDS